MIMLLVSCSNAINDADNILDYSNAINETDNIIYNSDATNDADNMPSGLLLPTDLFSIEALHNYMLSVRAYSNEIAPLGMDTDEEVEIRMAIDVWGLGDIEYYFAPSWLPEGFGLDFIGVNNAEVWYSYVIDGYNHALSFKNDYVLSNTVSFAYFIGGHNASSLLSNTVDSMGLAPADGVNGLYYRDFPATSNLDVNVVRCFYWVQDGYMFSMHIPLRLINEANPPGVMGIASADCNISGLVLNSALQIELVDGEYFEPPTSIELDELNADIPIGETIVLEAEVLPDNATIDAVIWSTSDNSVATVTQAGVVTKVGEGTATITARTVANDLTATFTVGDYEEDLPVAPPPTATPHSGEVFSGTMVMLSSEIPGATIHFTTDGSEPVLSSLIYRSPIAVTTDVTIKARVFMSGMAPSETAVFSYTVSNPGQYCYVADINFGRRTSGVLGVHGHDISVENADIYLETERVYTMFTSGIKIDDFQGAMTVAFYVRSFNDEVRFEQVVTFYDNQSIYYVNFDVTMLSDIALSISVYGPGYEIVLVEPKLHW